MDQQNFEPQQNLQNYPGVGQSYSSSQLQPQPMSVPVYVAPPQGQSNTSEGPTPCCGLMPLKTACYVIGTVGIVISVPLVCIFFLFLIIPGAVGSNFDYNQPNDDMTYRLITVTYTVMLSYIAVVLLVQVIHVIMNIVLVCGAASENPIFCITWIVVSVISLISRLVASLLVFGFALFLCLLDLWFIIVVVYYVKELNKKKGQTQTFIPPNQVPSMIQPTGAYSNPNVGPPPPYSQSVALMQPGPGQTYPLGQSY